MEEKNKRRRAALSQEVFDRQKRAAAETAMLKTIEVELAKLDQLLTADVAVLRYFLKNPYLTLFCRKSSLICILEIKLTLPVLNIMKLEEGLI